MWDKRKPLLAVIIVTALYYKVTAKVLDMAPAAVDAQYTKCRERVLTSIQSGLLERELSHTEGLQKAWSRATDCDPKLIPGGIKEHAAALGAYLKGDPAFLTSFNKATETSGVNVSNYQNDFHFKSLHFLLMDSIKLLNSKTCKTVFVFSYEKYKTEGLEGSDIRLGQFTKAYTTFEELKDAEDLEPDAVLLNITSCFFANLEDVCKEEHMALLSPAEVFTVERMTEGDESTYSLIVLKHSRLQSSHNCSFFSFSRSPADVSTQWLVLALVALSLFFFNC